MNIFHTFISIQLFTAKQQVKASLSKARAALLRCPSCDEPRERVLEHEHML